MQLALNFGWVTGGNATGWGQSSALRNDVFRSGIQGATIRDGYRKPHVQRPLRKWSNAGHRHGTPTQGLLCLQNKDSAAGDIRAQHFVSEIGGSITIWLTGKQFEYPCRQIDSVTWIVEGNVVEPRGLPRGFHLAGDRG
ncbi:hypothetical protein [Bradyrhizobium sp. 141]|uniref:hypothetical protein n=1 Tax=Bradyrhizobium sp. 141 TaxID=2782617 RepID=UPI001FF8E01F|nr:hypothetical protein [Bradyrhizobium sp. 141]MCK1721273.1 hypothetical protein [Bradyrhizobium sp. 141]